MRGVAFALFVCAAFNWTLPWIDRPGTAALGFGFVALSMGVIRESRRSILPFLMRGAATDATPTPISPMTDLTERLAPYALGEHAAATRHE